MTKNAATKKEAIKLSLRNFLEKIAAFLILVALFGLTVILTPLDLANIMANVMPAVWTALTTIGGMGLFALRRYVNHSKNNNTLPTDAYFNKHAAWIAKCSLLGYCFGLYFINNLMMLSAEFGLFLTKFTFGFEALSACAFFGGSYLFGLCAIFATGVIATKAMCSLYDSTRYLLDIRPHQSVTAEDKILAKVAKNAGLKKNHPFVKNLQDMLKQAPSIQSEEIFEWEIKAIIKFGKAPKAQQADLQKEILNEAKTLHYKMPS